MHCVFCRDFERGFFRFNGHRIERELYDSGNFCVFPGLGQIVEGYLLIATWEHHVGMGGIPPSFYDELEKVMMLTRRVLAKHYSQPLFFEHGPASACDKGSCCIVHAHIHVMPTNVGVANVLSRDFPAREISSLLELRKSYERGTPYFFVEDTSGRRQIFEIDKPVPSQYIRQIIADGVGRPERWNWQTYSGIDDLLATMQRLERQFGD